MSAARRRRGGSAGRALACGLTLGCGPTSPGETESASATSSSATTATTATSSSEATGASTTTGAPTSTGDASSTGELACALAVGPVEGQDPDPAGCHAITDASACEGLEADATCLAIRGFALECRGDAWCTPTGAEPLFLGCRPWAICKAHDLMVCREGPSGTQAFWADACLPAGFSACEPASGPSPPPACE